MKQKRVFFTVGIPASGKTSFINKQINEYGGIHISRDAVRFALLKPTDNYFELENEVFEVFVKKVQEAIDSEVEDVYIDATHISYGSRKKILNRLNLDNANEIIMLYFDVAADVAIARNESRTGRSLVPETAIRNMAKKITKPTPGENFRVWTINENGEVISIE